MAAAVLLAACGKADVDTVTMTPLPEPTADSEREALEDTDYVVTVTPLPEPTADFSPDPTPTPTWAPEPTLLGPPLVHPSTHEEAVRLSEGIVENYGEVWPWIKDAWTWSTLKIYDARGNALQCGGQMGSGCITGSTIHVVVDGVITNDDVCCIEWAERLIGYLSTIWDFEMLRLMRGYPQEDIEYTWEGTDRQRDWLHLRSKWESYHSECSEDEQKFDSNDRLQHSIWKLVTTNRLYRNQGFEEILACSYEGLEHYEVFDSQPYKIFEEMARLLINCKANLSNAQRPDQIEQFNIGWRNKERRIWSEELRLRNWADIQAEFC